MATYTVSNIMWDIDYYPDEEGNNVDLPSTVTVEVPDDVEDHDGFIGDHLSDTYGFCHHGFDFQRE